MTEKDQQEKRLGKSLNTHVISLRGVSKMYSLCPSELLTHLLYRYQLSDYNVKNISSNPSSKLYMADVLQESFICYNMNFYTRIQTASFVFVCISFLNNIGP